MTATLTRPNGKTYRPRSGVRVETYTTHDDMTAVVVIGTHDVDHAAELARHTWDCEQGTDVPLPDGVRRWWRLVPWSTGHGYDRSWIDDEVRGRPVVTFDPEPW